jgi:hypothetical protein
MTKRFDRRATGKYLTKRDMAIVEAVFEARYLTVELISELLFSPTTLSGCKRRLRKLFDLGFLGKRRTYQNAPDIYYLGVKGRHFMDSDYSRDYVKKVAGTDGDDPIENLVQVRHDLTVAKLYVSARLQAQKLGLQMDWRNARMLELDKLGVQPDAWICVSRPQKSTTSVEAYIEFTAQITSRAEIEKKVSQYGGLEKINVLWFTTSKYKERLISEVASGSFGVGLIDDAKDWLTAPMWWSGGQKVSWIRKPEKTG